MRICLHRSRRVFNSRTYLPALLSKAEPSSLAMAAVCSPPPDQVQIAAGALAAHVLKSEPAREEVSGVRLKDFCWERLPGLGERPPSIWKGLVPL